MKELIVKTNKEFAAATSFFIPLDGVFSTKLFRYSNPLNEDSEPYSPGVTMV
jgi:hypothetical protein